MAADEALLERLDRIASLLEVAFADRIQVARDELRADAVVAAVLDAIRDDWVSSGDIKRSVSVSTSVSEKTVQRALAALLSRGAIRARGSGSTIIYRSVGFL